MNDALLGQKIGSVIASYRFNGKFGEGDVESLRAIAERADPNKCASDSATVSLAVKHIVAEAELSEEQERFLFAALLNIGEQNKKFSLISPASIGMIGIIVTIVVGVFQFDSSTQLKITPYISENTPRETTDGAETSDTKKSTEAVTTEDRTVVTEEDDPRIENEEKQKDSPGTREVIGASDHQKLVLAVQLLVVLTFFAYSEKRYKEVKRFQNATVERRVVEQFAYYTRWIWLSWVALYSSLLLEAYTTSPTTDSWLKIFAELFNNWTSAAFLIAFAVLDQPSIEIRQGDNRNKPFVRIRNIAIFLVTTCASLVAMGEYLDVSEPGIRFAIQLPTSLFAGVSMAYFVGRIDSKMLSISRLSIGVLYAYAVIQVTWPAIQSYSTAIPEALKSLIFLFSLFGKFVLWRVLESLFELDASLLREYMSWASEYVRKIEEQKRAWQAELFR